MTAKADSLTALQLPAAAVDVALTDSDTCGAIGKMSRGWWEEQVRAGRAPQPVVRKPRCTRWRLVDVIEFWRRFAEQDSSESAADLIAHATKASRAARAAKSRVPHADARGGSETHPSSAGGR